MNTAMLLKPKSMVAYIYGDLSAKEGLKEFIAHGFTAVPVIDREGMYLGAGHTHVFAYSEISRRGQTHRQRGRRRGRLSHQTRRIAARVQGNLSEDNLI